MEKECLNIGMVPIQSLVCVVVTARSSFHYYKHHLHCCNIYCLITIQLIAENFSKTFEFTIWCLHLHLLDQNLMTLLMMEEDRQQFVSKASHVVGLGVYYQCLENNQNSHNCTYTTLNMKFKIDFKQSSMYKHVFSL